MESKEVEEYVQDLAESMSINVEEVNKVSERKLHIVQSDADADRTVLFAGLLFDQLGSDFEVIDVDETNSDHLPKHYYRTELQEYINQMAREIGTTQEIED
jgi:hypothetical protein